MGPISGREAAQRREKPLRALQSCFMCAQALCAAVVSPDVLQTMALVFSGADVMCATGDPAYSTPYLLAQRAGQKLQMEFLHQNKLSGRRLFWRPSSQAVRCCTAPLHFTPRAV